MNQPTIAARRTLLAALVLLGGVPLVWLGLRAPAPGAAQEGERVVIQLPLTLANASRLPRPEPLAPAEATAIAATATAAAEPSATVTEAVPTASATLPPPTATMTPTATMGPPSATPTAEPTATPTVAAQCEEYLANGSFDEGSVRWDLFSTYRARSLSQIIMKQDPNTLPIPVDGQWIARLGGGQNGGLDEIFQPHRPDRPWEAIPPESMISATLRFSFAVFTELPRNRRPDDVLSLMIYDVDTEREYALEGGELSEESAPELEWRRLALDATRQMSGSRGERLGIKIRSRMRDLDDGLGTFHFLDAMSLQVCTRPEPAWAGSPGWLSMPTLR